MGIKSLKNQLQTGFQLHSNALLALLFSVAVIVLLPVSSLAQQATLTDDAQTSTSNPNQNFGSRVSVQVSGTTFKGFLKFKLTPNLPNGTTGVRIEKATLKLFVTAVNTAGAAEVYRVAGAWDEGSITNNTAPALGSLLTSLSFDATNEDRWVTVDIKSLVKDWLDNVVPNNGVALVAAPGGLNVTFNSKENGTTSHEPLLEILLSHVATADHATTADSATTAGHASTADTANALAGSATVNGNQVSGALTNATIAGSSITGVVPIVSGGTGSSTQNFVDLSSDQTVAGNKTFSSAVNTNTAYNIGGFRIFHNTGGNLSVGIAAGESNTTGGSNSFFGSNAGRVNTTGSGNSFFGTVAGQSNTSGSNNAFFGFSAGSANTNGIFNAFFGQNAGQSNTTGNNNAFFGGGVGQANTTANSNSFFGSFAGLANTTGSTNVFFGMGAGSVNTTGSTNTFVGQGAGNSNTVENSNTFIGAQANGAAGISNATAIGANSVVTASDTMVLGTNIVTVQVPGNLNVNGAFTGSIPAGSGNYIQNTTSPQASSNFNISGDGTVGGSLFANFVNATEYKIGGQRVMSNAGASNMFVGAATGAANTTGSGNSFFGAFAGQANTTGDGNSFFGNLAGSSNTSGSTNSFFGWTSGLSNTSGTANSFFGFNAGNANTTGGENAFFGNRAGEANTTGARNSFFGSAAGKLNNTGAANAFFGGVAGQSNTSGSNNSFFGESAGQANTSGQMNAFFGTSAGAANTTAHFNSIFGTFAGLTNSTGEHNSFFGFQAGRVSTGDNNSFFGSGAGQSNESGIFNAFFGSISGVNNTTGSFNTFYGHGAGAANTTGSANTFVGRHAGNSNTTENNNTYIGHQANGVPGIFNATAIGANAIVTQSDTLVLGTLAMTVQVPGNLSVANSFSANGSNLTNLNANNISTGTLDNSRLGVVPIANGGTGSSTQNFVDLANDQSVSGNKAFSNNVTVGNSSTGGSLTLTNTTNRFLELGSNLGFDSVSGTVVGLRLKSTHPLENFSYGIFHGSNVFPGALIFRKDDESISPGDARNRLIIAGNGDVIVNPGKVGIGTSSPSDKLTVVGSVRIDGPNLAGNLLNMFNGDPGEPTFATWNYPGLQWSAGLEPAGGDVYFRIRHSPGPNVISISNSNNYIALGPTIPTFPLHVVGNSYFESELYAQGNVGIGTTNPVFKLDVAGDVNFSGSARTGSHHVVNGNLFVQNTFPQVNLDNGTGLNLASFNATTGPGSTAAIGSVPGTSFVIRSGGLDSIFIDPTNQRVGIGTPSPTERLEVGGNLRINGDFVATGTKSAVVTLADNREVRLYAVESPGNWFEDFGSGRLNDGVVTVSLDPLFAQTVNTNYTYHVFLTANGNCRGLYVAKKTATTFEVRELGGGRSKVTFDYRIVARRRGYEQVTSR